MATVVILGLEVPDSRPVFLVALGIHVVAGLTCVISGALAATAAKRTGRHPRAGVVYYWAITVVAATAAVMATMRWRQDVHLFVFAVVALALAVYGRRMRRLHKRGWVVRHGIGMGGSYIVLLTAFYIDNGPQLPLWNRLPHWSYWVLPTAVGIPLIGRALRRFRATTDRRGQRP
jgi:lysylphosphatidylglycerol synthetase-like protein (DUF2156 family)